MSKSLLWCSLRQDDTKQEDDSVNKRRRKGNHYLTEVGSHYSCANRWQKLLVWHFLPLSSWHQLSCHSAPPTGEDGELRENKVRSMATQLLAKFEENSTAQTHSKVRNGLKYFFAYFFFPFTLSPFSSHSYLFHQHEDDLYSSPPESPAATPLPLSDEDDEEEEEKRENPRFAKPKDLPPPSPPLSSLRPALQKWQVCLLLSRFQHQSAITTYIFT